MSVFHLPDLGEGLEEAEIREWYVKPGDKVELDQPLVSVETAKALVDVPSPQSGFIAKLYGNPGEFIKTHAPLIAFSDEKTQDQGSVVGRLEEGGILLDEKPIVKNPTAAATARQVKAMPKVRQFAKELNVDLNQVSPSGADGQITMEDVKKFKEVAHSEDEVLHGVRHFMAKAMQAAHLDIVPVTLVDDADITDLAPDADITVALIQAIIAGVKAEPTLNAWYDSKKLSRHLCAEVHLGLAMDTKEGLFVPVIKNCAIQNKETLRNSIEILKRGVKDRSIPKDDLQGATITLSNFGMFAGRYATVMIMPPTVAILGCGKIEDRVAVKKGEIAIRRIAPLSLSFDHRVVTGGEAARFLAKVIATLEGNAS